MQAQHNVDTLGFDVSVQERSPHNIIPFHGVASEERLESLKESFKDKGWSGTPIVVYNDGALGGAHRIAAARELDMDIPVVEIEDLIEATGEDPEEYDIQGSNDAIEALGLAPDISEFA